MADDPRVMAVRAVCRRVAGGETVDDICRDPLMPRPGTLYDWMRDDPALREMVDTARASAGLRGKRRGAARRAVHHYSDALAEAFLQRIEDGLGLVEACADPQMPTHTTVRRWLAEDEGFLRRYELARQVGADRLFDLAWRIACEATEADVRVAKLRIDTIKWRVRQIAPRRYGAPAQVIAAQAAAQTAQEERHFVIRVRKFSAGPDEQPFTDYLYVRDGDGWRQETLPPGVAVDGEMEGDA